jgi:hypothetical protein
MGPRVRVSWMHHPRVAIRSWKRLIKKRWRIRDADAIVVSMAKSGRTWLNAMLSHYYHLTEGAPSDQLLNADNFKRLGLRVPSIHFSHGREIIGHPELEKLLRHKSWVFVYRDPRDVAVSWYFHRLRRKPVAGRGAFLADEPILFEQLTADLLLEEGWLPAVVNFMNQWKSRLENYERTLFLRYEDMRADPERTLTDAIGFIDARSVSPNAIRDAVEFASFENLRRLEQAGHFQGNRLGGGRAGEEGTWKVRRGKVGGYADYFGPEEIQRIDRFVALNLHPGFRCSSATVRMPTK